MRFERELTSWDEIGKPEVEKKQIYFPDKLTSLYIKSNNWGLTYDHKITVISTSPVSEFKADSITEYIFYGFDGLIYKAVNDTLKIYSRQKPKIPTDFDSEVYIDLIEIKNNSEWNKLKQEIHDGFQYFE
ncbi:hypothetical protein GCM10008083_33780 [Ulvibacter litoralis]|nr:hypothetical protein GCM10008083_33780 [Ulvibacter litoralis]